LKPYFSEDGIVIYHGDCREILPGVSADAVITDPPYGTNNVLKGRPAHDRHGDIFGDDSPFDPTVWLTIGSQHLFWGAINFSNKLPQSQSWFIWLKRPETFDNCKKSYAPCELAWSDFGGHPLVKHHTWDGNFRLGVDSGPSVHPAQKPTEVMQWCVDNCSSEVILDPYMGSGTTLVAAKNRFRRAIGIEIEEKYCEIAAKRLSQKVLQFDPSA
jgi:DNA modification methylase